jgi:hypothetical protein
MDAYVRCAALKSELEKLINEAEERRAIEGEKYCPLITRDIGFDLQR